MGGGPEIDCLDGNVYRDLVNQMPVGATIARWEDPPDAGSFRYIWVNEAAKSLTGEGRGGVSYNEFLGKTIREAFPTLMDSGLPDAFARAITTGETQELGRF